MVTRLLSVVVVIAVMVGALTLLSVSSVRPAAPASPSSVSLQASPQASPATSPVALATVDPGEATIAALQTQVAAMSGTATAEAAVQATIAALSTQSASIAETATSAAAPPPTETPTPEPTATQTETPTPTPLPEAGEVLYEIGESGFAEWATTDPWNYLNGMLINDGGTGSLQIEAPYSPGNLADYAVEAEIQGIGGCDTTGIYARSVEKGAYFGGTFGGDFDRVGIKVDLNQYPTLGESTFTPGADWHTYRLEVKGNRVRLLVDEVLMADVVDNQFLDPGTLGVWAGCQVSVRSFQVIAL